MYHTILIYSSVDGHLGCFHFSTIVNSAERSMELYTSFQHTDLISFRYVPRTSIARSYGGSIFNFFFLWNLHTVFHMAMVICIPTSSVKGFPFLSIQQLLSLVFFITAIPHWGEQRAHCGFVLPFSDNWWHSTFASGPLPGEYIPPVHRGRQREAQTCASLLLTLPDPALPFMLCYILITHFTLSSAFGFPASSIVGLCLKVKPRLNSPSTGGVHG